MFEDESPEIESPFAGSVNSAQNLPGKAGEDKIGSRSQSSADASADKTVEIMSGQEIPSVVNSGVGMEIQQASPQNFKSSEALSDLIHEDLAAQQSSEVAIDEVDVAASKEPVIAEAGGPTQIQSPEPLWKNVLKVIKEVKEPKEVSQNKNKNKGTISRANHDHIECISIVNGERRINIHIDRYKSGESEKNTKMPLTEREKYQNALDRPCLLINSGCSSLGDTQPK